MLALLLHQPDHTVIDRKDAANGGKILDILCRLTRANGKVGSLEKNAAEQSDELRRISGSSLEHAWLDFVEQRIPKTRSRAGNDSVA